VSSPPQSSPPARKGTHQLIYDTVGRIPRGRVSTYGQIAALAGFPGQARLVGYALNRLSDDRVPWQRVINSQGRISPRADSEFGRIQRALLEAEGITFFANGRVSLERFGWRPRERL
jgi:methylated-DNA-protein-cysteine methyltransferase-like protein